jgi:neutral ceramidase
MTSVLAVLVGLAVVGLGARANGADDTYLIGTGRYDVTGPAAEVEMMGYAMPTQITHGIHFRQWSRAFIIADSSDTSRVVFVNVDICMGTQILKMQVVEKLKALYGDLYTNDNVLISGIHTHSGPAGYFQYLLFEVMSLGFVKESLDAIVGGVVASIQEAHESRQPGKLYLNSGLLAGANINRSPAAYVRNPKEERMKYMSVGNDTDHEMVVLKMVGTEGNDIGMIDWFAVHCTSMNKTNSLISGDNKGHASFLMESAMSPQGTLPGHAKFVAAFAQSNEGDVSPNTKGPHCLDTGKPCDLVHSTCNGRNEQCVAFGPGVDMFDSTRIIAEKQFNMGKSLYEAASQQVTGPVQFRHSFVDFSDVAVNISDKIHHTCPPAMGEAFAAGTTDGPGAFDFKQASNTTNPIWIAVRDFLHKPTKEQIECQSPKPILLDTGFMNFPYPWQARILPLQLLRIGQLVIIGVPAELTTMSGRRTREAVKNILVKYGKDEGFGNGTVPVIAGLSNTYSDYVATFEEYQASQGLYLTLSLWI